MKKNREKSRSSSDSPSFLSQRGSPFSPRLPDVHSPSSLSIKGDKEEIKFSNLSDYQLTVRPKIELTRYQISMLLEIKCYEVWKFGLDFVNWITLEYLFSRLLGSRKVWEIRDSKERKSLTLANIILLTSQNNWLQLGERIDLPKEILNYLENSGLLASQRTIESRLDYWKPEKFLEVRAVPLGVFLERESNTSRYSSYCKGYGESGRMGRRVKTRPSAELDGEDEDRPEVEIPLVEIPNLLILTMLEIRRKYEKKR